MPEVKNLTLPLNKNEHDQENLVSVYRIISYGQHKKVLVLQIGSANNKNSLLTNNAWIQKVYHKTLFLF